MSEIVQLFGGTRTQEGKRLSSSLARQVKRETDQTAARAEIVAVEEQARAFLASQAMTNVSTLISQAQAYMQVNPAGAELFEDIIRGYAHGAGVRLSRF